MANFNVMEYLKAKAREQQRLDDEMKTSEEELLMAELDREEMEKGLIMMAGGLY